MKILFLTALIATSFAINPISPKCMWELGKLGVDVAKIGGNVLSGNLIGLFWNGFITYNEFKKVSAACSPAEILEYAGLNMDIGKCLQETYVVY